MDGQLRGSRLSDASASILPAVAGLFTLFLCVLFVSVLNFGDGNQA